MVENIIKANETKRVKSYFEAGCINTDHGVQSVSKCKCNCFLCIFGISWIIYAVLAMYCDFFLLYNFNGVKIKRPFLLALIERVGFLLFTFHSMLLV